MTVLHLVANRVLPYPGGLQESVLRIGRGLAQAGFQVIVYTLHQPAGYLSPDASHEGLTVVHVGGRELLLEPYGGAGFSELLATESSRVTTLLLRNAIERQREQHPDARHLVISFFASGTGFTAQMAATSLRLPHVASVRGTDFELDVFGTKQHPRLRATIEGASLVVTTNRAQAEGLAAIFRVRQPIRTIHNALPDTGPRPRWESTPAETVRLVSDCGFSGRKGTHLLLRAVAQLIDRGVPVSLTVLGGIFWLEDTSYWEACQRSYEARYPGSFWFPGQVSHVELDRYLRAAHVYTSATLAEGSSLSRIRALTIGIPIVTTATGELPEVASGGTHVRLCRAADHEPLAAELEAVVTEIRAGTLSPDRECIERWQRHYSVEREREQWIAAIDAALGTSGASA